MIDRIRGFPLSWSIGFAVAAFDLGYWLGRLWA